CIVWMLRMLQPTSPRSLLAGVGDGEKERKGVAFSLLRRVSASNAAITFGLIGLLLLLAAVLDWIGQVAGFFGAGTLLLVGLLCYQSARLRRRERKLIQGSGWWPVSRL